MATTSRKGSRVGEGQRASSASAAKRDKPFERSGDGMTNGRDGGAAKSNAAADKTRKSDKMVRDTFKMPQREYELIDELKKRCRALGVEIKKSEVLRAGLIAMRELSDERLGDVVRPLTAPRAERAASKRAKSATAA